MNDVVERQYIAVTEYNNGVAKCGKTVSASDRVSAMVQFDLMNESYVDVMLYVANDQLYTLDIGIGPSSDNPEKMMKEAGVIKLIILWLYLTFCLIGYITIIGFIIYSLTKS